MARTKGRRPADAPKPQPETRPAAGGPGAGGATGGKGAANGNAGAVDAQPAARPAGPADAGPPPVSPASANPAGAAQLSAVPTGAAAAGQPGKPGAPPVGTPGASGRPPSGGAGPKVGGPSAGGPTPGRPPGGTPPSSGNGTHRSFRNGLIGGLAGGLLGGIVAALALSYLLRPDAGEELPALRAEVDRLQGTVAGLERGGAPLDQLAGRIDALEQAAPAGADDELQARLAALEQTTPAVADLASRIEALETSVTAGAAPSAAAERIEALQKDLAALSARVAAQAPGEGDATASDLALLETLQSRLAALEAEVPDSAAAADIALRLDALAQRVDALASLGEQSAGIQDDVAALSSRVAGLDEQVAGLRAPIDALRADVEELSTRAAATENRVVATRDRSQLAAALALLTSQIDRAIAQSRGYRGAAAQPGRARRPGRGRAPGGSRAGAARGERRPEPGAAPGVVRAGRAGDRAARTGARGRRPDRRGRRQSAPAGHRAAGRRRRRGRGSRRAGRSGGGASGRRRPRRRGRRARGSRRTRGRGRGGLAGAGQGPARRQRSARPVARADHRALDHDRLRPAPRPPDLRPPRRALCAARRARQPVRTSMIRLILFLVVAVGLSLVAAWLADHPGRVSLIWQGTQIETSVAVLIVGVVLFGVLLVILFEILRLVRGAPRRLGQRWRRSRTDRGYQALTQGLVAAAAGDTAAAKAFNRRAEKLLDHTPSTLLLSAQAAQLEGDERAARSRFQQMLKHPQTEFLGLRGLLAQAIKDGDSATALELARRAYLRRPNTPWVLATLFDLQTQAGLWTEALGTVGDMAKHKLIDRATASRRRAILFHQQAAAQRKSGRPYEALALAQKAHKLLPSLAPLAVQAAELAEQTDQPRAARKVLEAAWRAQPHPALAQAYLAQAAGQPPAERMKLAERLHQLAPDPLESELMLAEQAISAKQWQVARNALERARRREPTASVYRLLAEVEQAEGELEKARAWLAKAVDAAPDPAWLCPSTGEVRATWSPFGPDGRFDSLRWGSPPKFVPLLRDDAEAQLIPPLTAPGHSAARTAVVPRPATPLATVAGTGAPPAAREAATARAAAP